MSEPLPDNPHSYVWYNPAETVEERSVCLDGDFTLKDLLVIVNELQHEYKQDESEEAVRPMFAHGTPINNMELLNDPTIDVVDLLAQQFVARVRVDAPLDPESIPKGGIRLPMVEE